MKRITRQCTRMRPTMEEDYWGRKLLQAVRKYMHLRETGLNAYDCEMDDLFNIEEEEKEEGFGEEATLQEKRQKVMWRIKRKRNTVARRKKFPKWKVKKNYLQNATVGSQKSSRPQTKKKEMITSHRHFEREKSNKKKREQLRIKHRQLHLLKGRLHEGKDIYNGWLPQMMKQKELCFKRRRLKTLRLKQGRINTD